MTNNKQNKSQIKSGIIMSYLTLIVQNCVSIIYTPIMIRLLGQSEYGLYNLVSSFISYLGLLNFGFDNTYLRYYTQYKHTESKKRVASLNGMFFIVFGGIGILAAICGIVMAENTSIIFGDKLTIEELSTAKNLMLILAINIGLTFPCNLFKIYINANEKFAVTKIVGLTQTIINPFIVLPLLLMGYKSVALVSVTLVYTIATGIFNIIYSIKKLDFHIRFSGFEFKLFRGIATFSIFVFLGEIVDEINWQLDKFLLGRFSGTVAVAVYGVAANLSSYFRQFSTCISSVFAPKINKIVALHEGDGSLTSLMIKVGRIQFLVLSLAASGFVLCGRSFCNLWVGNEYNQSYFIAVVLILPSIVPLIQNVGISVLVAKNKHKFRSVVYFLIACLNIMISIPLCMKFEGLGCAIGTAVSLIMGNGIIINLYYKRIGINITAFWKEIGNLSKGLVPPIIIGAFCTYFVELTNWGSLFVFIIVYSCIFLGSMYLFGMNDYEKNLIQAALRRCKHFE